MLRNTPSSSISTTAPTIHAKLQPCRPASASSKSVALSSIPVVVADGLLVLNNADHRGQP